MIFSLLSRGSWGHSQICPGTCGEGTTLGPVEVLLGIWSAEWTQCCKGTLLGHYRKLWEIPLVEPNPTHTSYHLGAISVTPERIFLEALWLLSGEWDHRECWQATRELLTAPSPQWAMLGWSLSVPLLFLHFYQVTICHFRMESWVPACSFPWLIASSTFSSIQCSLQFPRTHLEYSTLSLRSVVLQCIGSLFSW